MSKPWLGHRMTYADPACQEEVDRLRQKIVLARTYHFPIFDRVFKFDKCERCGTQWPCRTTEALSDV